jgi:hypothetical protein
MARNKKNWDYLVDYYGNYRSVLGTGQKGDPGPTGTGTQGIQGVQGVQGNKGPQGNKGDQGPLNSNAFEFKGQVANQAALPATGNTTGDTWLAIDTNLMYSWDGGNWVPLGGASSIATKGAEGDKGVEGEKGIQGVAATVAAGLTTTGAAGTVAAVSNSGSATAATFDFTIPEGDKGEPGTLPLISSLPVLP